MEVVREPQAAPEIVEVGLDPVAVWVILPLQALGPELGREAPPNLPVLCLEDGAESPGPWEPLWLCNGWF